MHSELFRLVYGSSNAVGDQNPRAEIGDILAKSRANNARCGVTGALLYSDGCFAQALEGPVAAVHETFERIQCDPRHKNVVVLQAGPATGRLFGAWSMTLAGGHGHALADVRLRGVLAGAADLAGDDVLALLNDLVQREAEWLAVAS